MFRIPVQFYEFLSHHDLIDDIYKAMESPDLAEPVITVLKILVRTKNLPAFKKEAKSEIKSTEFRNEGNRAYATKKYQNALICYNKALLYAPKCSRAMKLAYSNRSALLYKISAFSACLSDIESCFSMGCPPDIIEKLKKRKEEAKGSLWMEKLTEGAKFSVFSEEYFQFNVKRNPQIPCASTDVGVIVENQVPKIVATTDVKVGAVLAVETAFVSENGPKSGMFSCFYCHKLNLNLKPCDGCCYALFCDENCRQTCLEEYHSTECKMMEILEKYLAGTMVTLALKTVLKMKHMSKSWKELIENSFSLGMSRFKTSSINEIYDSNNKYSLLCAKDERHFLDGLLYNFSFPCATLIHYLDAIPGFFPQGDEKDPALRAVARLLMFLTLYSVHTQIILSVSINESGMTEFHNHTNYGWFSLIGKLKHSCNPNVLAVSLNKKTALLAVAPIKKGTELTVSYVGHWLENPISKEIRNRNMFMLYGFVCNCVICTEEYKNSNNNTLTDVQKKHFRKININEMYERFHPRNIPEIFSKLCKMLAFLSDLPFSEEYEQVFSLFRKCVLYLQDLSAGNVILDYV